MWRIRYVSDQSQSIQGSLSLGAAVGASILIASRLGRREHVVRDGGMLYCIDIPYYGTSSLRYM
jgi:hypothetical protein